MKDINITFGIIVLNGEPFTRYCIRALYPHAHEIIIAEGACEGARNIATSNGHSKDGTLEVLLELKKTEDPEDKITIVTAEQEGHLNGFWPGEKHEQCQAFAKRATGNYLWQVDIDEFYHDEDIEKIKSLLSDVSSITCLSFKQYGFWGGFDYLVDSWYLKRHLPEIYRVFKWGDGYKYISHRPPTVIDNTGINLKEINFLNSGMTEEMGIHMYHYSFVFPKQVFSKADYYSNSNWLSLRANDWASVNYMHITKPYRVFIMTEYPGWLEKFRGTHPLAIRQLISNIHEKKLVIEERDIQDIEKLLNSRAYQFGTFFLKLMEPVDRWGMIWYKKIKSAAKRLNHVLTEL